MRTAVLHIVENLDRGAVETWLVRMLAFARSCGIDLDWSFYCTVPGGGALDTVALAAGTKIVRSPVPLARKVEFLQALRSELKHGGYDVVHCHHDLISGIYLLAALGIKLRRRIVHVHNADESLLTPNPIKQALLREPLRRTCLCLADRIVGISNHTLDSFLAGLQRRPGRDVVHYYGIDPAPFETPLPDRVGFRRSLGFDDDARVLLFAGRIVPEKNPLFALDVLAEMRRIDPKVVGVFAGAGGLEVQLREQARILNLNSGCRFLGWRTDIADIMRSSDWFILPHPETPVEGFGIAVVEAQLARLRLLISTGIADDPLLPTAVYRRLSLSEGPVAWAQAGLAMAQMELPSSDAVWESFYASPLDMDFALKDLLALYQ